MGTIRIEQAGREYTVIPSNKGLRVEYLGVEIFRHWPDDAPPTGEPVPEPGPTDPPEPTPVDPAPVDPVPDPDPAPTPAPTPPPASGGYPTPSIPVSFVTVASPSELKAAINARMPAIGMADGTYGDVKISSRGAPVLVFPINPGNAVFRSILFSQSDSITFVAPTFLNDKQGLYTAQTPQTMWRVDPGCVDIHLFDAKGYGAPDHANYRNWTIAEWKARKIDAALVRGVRCTVVRCDWSAVYFGPQINEGNACAIIDNVTRGFAADSGRAVGGPDHVVRGNRSYDAFQIDSNHSDGDQVWSIGPDGKPGGGVMYRLTLEDNLRVAYIGPSVRGPNAAPIAKMQGFGGFNGRFDGFTVRRNTFVTYAAAHHGITLSGCDNSLIEDNVVLDLAGKITGGVGYEEPYINIGSGSVNTTLRNNVAANISLNGVRQIGLNGNAQPDYSKIDMAAIFARVAA